MSVASRRRVRQRLAEINLNLREEDGMSRPWMDNLPSKDIKTRPERSQGQPMQTEDANDYTCGNCSIGFSAGPVKLGADGKCPRCGVQHDPKELKR